MAVPQDYTKLVFKTIKLSHPLRLDQRTRSQPWPIQAVTVLTLSRPERMNAFNEDMPLEMVSVLDMLSKDDRVRVVVLTGAGRAFCAGADLEPSGSFTDRKDVTDWRDSGGQVSLAIYRCKKPVIAAINGAAVGIGITMTLACSIRISHSKAKIAFPFVRRGIIPEATSSFFLPHLLGYSRAMHLLITGETLPASHRLLDGLFSEILDKPEEVLSRALAIAEMIARETSPMSVWLTKELAWRSPLTAEKTHLLDSKVIGQLYGTPDNVEGVMSFLEKREPVFVSSPEKDRLNGVPWWKEEDTGVPKKVQSKL